MWFRNARPYRLPGRLGIDASELSQRLSRRPFQPCRPSQPVSSGWVAALSDDATDFVHKSGDYWLIRLQREERLLPASVIRSEVNSRIQEIQTGQGRRVQRKERFDIVDEVTQDLMPRAFTKSQHLEALINDREGWVWVNTASAVRAEELLSLLREGLGNLPVVIPDTQKSPVVVMSQWLLNGGLPEGLSLGAMSIWRILRRRAVLFECGVCISNLMKSYDTSSPASRRFDWPYPGKTKSTLWSIRISRPPHSLLR